ncbi:30S ribosomal protein S16 [candidate division WWE3 bacterium]|nr:30S ribosomal protein S16 [candidate division WWE3 bacterium]
MSVTIRLARIGKKNAPAYKIVAAQTRTKRTGKFLDVLGYFNPSEGNDVYEIDMDKYQDWKNKGALSTEAVEKLIEGTYEYKVYNPNAEEEVEEEPKEEAEATPEEDSTEAETEAGEEKENNK